MDMKKMDNIAILRVIACLMVFIVHLGQRMNLDGMIRNITDLGQMGIYLFFIISGFCGIMSFEHSWGGKSTKYLFNRFVRILTLYYVVILYYFITETYWWRNIPDDVTRLGWIRYIFLLHGFVKNDTYFWSNLGITWTVPIFVLFYLIMPLLNKVVKNYNCALFAWFLSLIVYYMVQRYCGGNLMAISYLFYFMEGIVLYFAKKEQKQNVTIGGICILLIYEMRYGTITPTCYSFLFMIIFIVSQDIIIRNELLRKTVYTLDKYSYTIYLGHGLVFCGLIDKCTFTRIEVLGIAIIGTSLLVYVLHNFVEQPIQKKVLRMMDMG